MSRAWGRLVGQGLTLVLLPYEALHDSVYFIDIDWDGRFGVAWIVYAIRGRVAHALHVLSSLSASCTALAVTGLQYLDLLNVPLVHAERLDLGDVSSQLAMQGGTA